MRKDTLWAAVLCAMAPTILSAAESPLPLTTSRPDVPVVHERRWKSGDDPEQSLCAVGNGRVLAYLKGPDIAYVWGPPYSSPNLATARLQASEPLTAISSREVGACVWRHSIRRAGDRGLAGTFVDYVDAELPCLVRMIEADTPMTLLIDVGKARVTDTSSRYPGSRAFLCTHPVGSPVYGYRFSSQQPVTIQVLVRGSAVVELPSETPGIISVRLTPGRSSCMIVGGPELPQCVACTDLAMAAGPDQMLVRTRAWWQRELSGIRFPRAEGLLGRRLATIAEDVAVNLISQQAVEGAVLAGHNYCLGYVRDQFGVARGLLDLGLHHRARQVLAFYWQVFQQAGRIQNAQTIGGWPYFHVHENDDVEMTAYLIQQAMEYMDRTADAAFVREIFPLLDWAFWAQTRHIARGMLPFNGDETYIAGGMLPRSAMDDGSAEASYLFFASGERLADWAERQGLWSTSRADEARRLCHEVEATYRENFVVEGRLMLNNPARTAGLRRERFRHGVCQGQSPGCLFFGWLERGEDNRYCCERCYVQPRPQPAPPDRHYLPSVALTPLFVGRPIPSCPITREDLEAALAPFRSADGQLGYGARRLPGYELGFLLYAMSELRHPEAGRMTELLMDLVDPCGAWVEYYEGSLPQGTRYRPWESAINYSALARYTRSLEGSD